MKLTTYCIEKKHDGYALLCIEGPYKVGLEKITAEDESSLLKALIGLRVPEADRATALQDLRDKHRIIVTFDAKTMETL